MPLSSRSARVTTLAAGMLITRATQSPRAAETRRFLSARVENEAERPYVFLYAPSCGRGSRSNCLPARSPKCAGKPARDRQASAPSPSSAAQKHQTIVHRCPSSSPHISVPPGSLPPACYPKLVLGLAFKRTNKEQCRIKQLETLL